MTRDVRERLELFMGSKIEVRRLALNMDQVEEHSPPPNPAKETDSRFSTYLVEFGEESWELDALDPATLAGLVRGAVEELRDEDAWQAATDRENEGKRLLGEVAQNWDKLTKKL